MTCLPPNILINSYNWLVYTENFNAANPTWREVPGPGTFIATTTRDKTGRLWAVGDFGISWSEDFLEDVPTWNNILTIEDVLTYCPSEFSGAEPICCGNISPTDIEVSPLDENYLVVALNWTGSGSSKAAVIISTDRGATWNSVTVNSDYGCGGDLVPGAQTNAGKIMMSHNSTEVWWFGARDKLAHYDNGSITLSVIGEWWSGIQGGYIGENDVLIFAHPGTTPPGWHYNPFTRSGAKRIYMLSIPDIYGVGPTLYYTDDDGETWVEKSYDYYAQAVHGLAGNAVIKLRAKDTYNDYPVSVSLDDGETWVNKTGNLFDLLGYGGFRQGKVYVIGAELTIGFNGVTFDEIAEVPSLPGDRAAYDAYNYPELHANDRGFLHMPTAYEDEMVPLSGGGQWSVFSRYALMRYLTMYAASGTYDPNFERVILVNATGDVEIRLPAQTENSSTIFYVRRQDATTNTVTITALATPGTGTIDGEASLDLGIDESVILVNGGLSNWYTLTKVSSVRRQLVYTFEGLVEVEEGLLNIPVNLGNLTIEKVILTAGGAPTGSSLYVDINVNGTSIFSSSGSQPHLYENTYAEFTTIFLPSLVDGDIITIDIDTIGSGEPGSDLVVTMVCK